MKSITGMVLSLQYWYGSVDDNMPKIFAIEEILTKLQKKIKGVSFFPWTLYLRFPRRCFTFL